MIYFETGYEGEVHDLEHPRILWNSICRRATVAASSQAAGFPAINALTATTYDAWKPVTLPASWTLTFDGVEPVNAVAIDTHTIGSSGAMLRVDMWNGTIWVNLIDVSPIDDEPIAILFNSISTDRLRITLTGSVVPQIAVIHFCNALELPQTVYMGAPTPIDMALATEFDTNISTGGRYMGRSVRYTKTENEFTVAHLTEQFVREELMPFIKDAREYPYFLLERPLSQPTALSYRWRKEDIRPARMGIKSYMQVSL
ncbi:MAG: hypothetical protein ACPG61_07070 [Paracoccaceae bacterium]